MAVEGLEDARVRWATLAMATFATTALEQAVLEPGHSRSYALGATLALLIAPTCLAARFLAKRGSALKAEGPRFGTAAPVALLILFAIPFTGEAARLAFDGRRSLLEITLLMALRNLGLGLAALAYRPVYARLSALVSLFLVTVASPIGGESGPAVVAPVAGFAVAGTLWLMRVYWKGLGPVAGRETSPGRFPLGGVAWALGVVATLMAVAAVGPSRAATALVGLMPTSGGTDWSDPDGRSGVGDGDHEVRGSENPQSVGFTESEIYLETDRPSLYDAFNESYGEPFKPKRLEKMVAIGPQNVAEQKERPAENLQAGREFSAVRRRLEARPKRPGEREAKALVYVKGPTPLHLPLTTYGHFDGTTWREEPCCNRSLAVEQEPSGTWLKLPWSGASFFAGVVAHRIKVGTLDSSPMPVPPHLTRFRVGSVNRLDFFGWAQYGIVRMTDRTVPPGTVIDSEARTVDPERLRATPFEARPGDKSSHNLSFHDGYTVDPAVAALAKVWTAGVPEGWAQVEAVVGALRRGYAHDRSATAAAGCTDVVAEFLLRSRRGPDYLFASSAAVVLRTLGYPARVVSGLYTAPGGYDPRTRHTPVTREGVHVWAEVRTPDGLWVAVEPTPGYELMPPVRPWHERLARALEAVGRWAVRHAAGLSALAVGLGVLAVRRRDVFDRLATLAFDLRPGRDPRRYVLQTLNLVERRARWAGRQRPTGATLARWYRPVASHADGEPRAALEELVRLADWAAHAPERTTLTGEPDVYRTCRAAVRAWTLARFRSVPPYPPRKAAAT